MIKQIVEHLSARKYQFPIFLGIMIFMTLATMYIFKPLCPGVDFYVHFNRLAVLMEALADGSFPYYMDYHVIDGYGYIIKLFYSDFLLIPFALIGNLTNEVIAYNSVIFSMTLLCGIFSYWGIKRITKDNTAAILAALLYTFCHYRMTNVYFRGALGEAFALSLIPLILWGVYEIMYGDKKRWYLLAIGFSMVIFTHVITTVLSILTVVIFLIIYFKYIKKEQIKYFIIAALTTFCITAYYTLPMIEQMLSNSFYYQTHKLADHMVTFKLNEIFTGLFNVFTQQNMMKSGVLLTFCALTRLFISKRNNVTKFMDTLLIVAVIYILLVSHLVPWHIFPLSLLTFIQCSWRLLGYVSLFFAFAGAYYISLLLKNKKQKVIGVIILIAINIFIYNSESMFYRMTICKNENHPMEINTSYYGMIGGEYLPSKVPSNNFKFDIPGVYNNFIHNRGQIVKPFVESTTISNLYKNKGQVTFDVEVDGNDILELPLTYYKGYKATLNGNEIEYQQSEYGLIELPVNESGKVEVLYTGSFLQKISYYITIASTILLIIFVIRQERKINNLKKKIG